MHFEMNLHVSRKIIDERIVTIYIFVVIAVVGKSKGQHTRMAMILQCCEDTSDLISRCQLTMEENITSVTEEEIRSVMTEHTEKVDVKDVETDKMTSPTIRMISRQNAVRAVNLMNSFLKQKKILSGSSENDECQLVSVESVMAKNILLFP